MIRKLQVLLLSVLCVVASHAHAFEPFLIKKIEVNGLQRITRGTVLNYLPIRVGEQVTEGDTTPMIRALYQTGFFIDVAISRQGKSLVVSVRERPTIASVRVTGNTAIPSEKFNSVLREVGVMQGRVYNPAVLDKIKQELSTVYNARGKYNSKIDVHLTRLARNRVAIHIAIVEGHVAKIKVIRFVGNAAFNPKTLLAQLPLSTSGWLSFFNHKDEYTREKLAAAEAALKSYYMNRGYIKMRLLSSPVSISPDRKHVYITFKIEENGRYTFADYRLSGRLEIPRRQLRSLIHITPGQTFSRQVVVEAVSGISTALGEIGYGFPQINPQLRFDDKKHTVSVDFHVNPGVKVYVRRVNFAGNTRTVDSVLRQALRQHEGQLISISQVKESSRQLRILPYLKDVTVTTQAVPGTNNQVDLTYHVTEANSAQFNLQFGYSTAEKFLVQASISEPNFLGSGRHVALKFSNSKLTRSLTFDYFNPYYAEFGLGRGFNVYYERNTPDRLNTISPYNNNRYGGAMSLRYTLNDHDNFAWSGGYEHLVLTHVSPDISQYVAFVDRYGTRFNQLRLMGTWEHNSLDKFPFPTSGTRSQFSSLLSMPVGKGLKYYKLSYLGRLYQPLWADFVGSLRGGIVFGDGLGNTDGLPFYENVFAGGIGSAGQARGYETFSLGPKDFTARRQPLGGNLLLSGSASLILPYPLSRDNLRSSVFIDAANVYAYHTPTAFQGTKSGQMRVSAGVGLIWQSPFGPLQFSLAWPLNNQATDRKELFQFNIASGL